MPMHDLVIKTIAQYFIEKNWTLIALMRVNQRFYGLRDIFISKIMLNSGDPRSSFRSRPYYDKYDYAFGKCGWTKVYSVEYDRLGDIKLSSFKNVHKVHLLSCQISDTTIINNISTLWLECCNISDVSLFSKINTIHLTHCHDIRDFSPLGSVYKLTIGWCNGLKNVASLNTVHILALYHCQYMRSYDELGLGSIHKLTLDDCDIEDVSPLKYINTLILKNCIYLKDVSSLTGVKQLIIEDCQKIKRLSMLSSVPSLTVSHCDNIVDLLELKNKYVNIDACRISIIRRN